MQLPGPFNTFELPGTDGFEPQRRAGDEIDHRARHVHLRRGRLCGDARRDVHRDPGNVAPANLELARMESGSHLKPKLACSVADGASADNGAPGQVECREVTVAGRLEGAAPESIDLPTCHVVVSVEHPRPQDIAEFGDALHR